MIKISPISNQIYSNQLNKVKSNNLSPLKRDTASFGKAKETPPAGSDVVLELIRKCAELLNKGESKIVTDAAGLIRAGKINEAIKILSEAAPPNGAITETEEGTKILAKNWDGSPVEHIFKHVKGFKNLGLVKSIDDAAAEKIYQDAFGVKPKATIGMVGWTNIKPETVKGGTSLSKAELTKAYEEAISDFYRPVDDYFVKGLNINPEDRALVSSVSYSGVDKAIMDLGEQQRINTLTVTPFDYSIYGRNEHPFPTIITDTIPQYVDIYGKLAKNIIVTGGRDHAFKYDMGGKWLRKNLGLAVPVDVLKDYKGIVVPATVNGKIENAAAAAYETFSNPIPKGTVKQFKNLPWNSYKQELQHPAQKALAASIARDLEIIK